MGVPAGHARIPFRTVPALRAMAVAHYASNALPASPEGKELQARLQASAQNGLCRHAGALVRWYESYLLGADIGHIPVSNLYEVFILFSLITALFHLYYEQLYKTRQMGPFVMLVVSAAIRLLVTTFVFLGVNMFLAGLHSYGTL